MIGTDIPHADVIAHDDDNVGFLLLRGYRMLTASMATSKPNGTSRNFRTKLMVYLPVGRPSALRQSRTNVIEEADRHLQSRRGNCFDTPSLISMPSACASALEWDDAVPVIHSWIFLVPGWSRKVLANSPAAAAARSFQMT